MEKSSQIHGSKPGDDNADEPENAAGQSQIRGQGADDLLDEIDGLLESNAEEFVRSYVQKGGQ
ncbi:ubiquitin-like protein Pup [Corynebacterium sp. MC-04]|jgi:pup-like protein|uniref:Prokaryotic ubiquitin-like protein Pup n=3 Tax=Corynebacterium TaxID=1716 RepID=A0AAU0Q4Q7_9CORY|nr:MULTISPECIES: ubiquitin-like protein Pup [Corynebacterium]KXB51032.1 ubiquitin-like protein Pup [Corynebacterium kroppenstedtii]MBY0787652.1 ubiquitin-like protein Pup [Corynebacterium parakroppenstedtii]MBY0790136.1 ubiquitin-like protein Pup [Corynebacterium pseudokroppenstedtii]MBY0791725.1 ubiquitin-like protein Pup [Corynebacterium parakroppenstedtii]MBY0796517.1 ubiquitin-like protein Pup [Corynebacterium parakroppenstedtii]